MKRAALLFVFLAAAWAQQDMGVFTGVITDASGGVIPDARVIVINRETGETRSVATSEGGAYTVGPLRVGRYDITVEKTGFKKAIEQDLELHAQDRVRA